MCEYKNITCISKMKTGYQNMFDEMVKEYAEKLSSRIILSNSAFTLHDFEHHCFNIYKIISYVLFDEKLVYQDNYGLSQRELFVLNLAVLFHDIGMSQVLGVFRENHSVKSAEYIQKEYDSGRPLRTKTNLTPNEIKALKAIVIAHSNIKDETISIQENGLNSPKLVDYSSKDGTLIRAKFLAGVLRIADELDISSERLGSGEIELQISEGKRNYEKLLKEAKTDFEKIELVKWEGYLESLKHWKKLHLIANIRRNDDGETIEICIDDEYIDRCLDDGNTEKSLGRDIADIYLEIEKKLNEAVKLAFTGEKFGKYVFVKKLQVITNNKNLENEIHDNLSVKSLPIEHNKSKPVINKKQSENFSEKTEPQVIDLELEKFIYEEVQKRGLIKFGHYLLNDIYCARDWIDTQEVVETKKILNRLVEAIVKDINSRKQKKVTIIGVDLVGALLASRIAFSLQSPLSYIVPTKEESHNANQEIELSIDKERAIVLITDAIVTFDTLHRAIKKYSLEERIDSIYTIFYRPNDRVESKSPFLNKTFSVNNMFLIELFEKRNCLYNKNKCIALNQKLSKGDNVNENR